MPNPGGPLAELVDASATDGGAAWLQATIAEVRRGAADLDVVFPAVSRKVGRAPLLADGAEASLSVTLRGHPYEVPLAAWRCDDGARALLLAALVDRGAALALATARRLYFQGDARERVGALRALPLLGDGDEALDAVLDAMRVNDGAIFEAALCDNPYAAAALPDHDFRKAVLKCIFVGMSVRRIARLDERADAELCASLLDYIREREAATRGVAPELWPLCALHPPPGLTAKLLGYLEHPNPDHRAEATAALARLADPRVASFLTDRRARETDAGVRRALDAALAAAAAR